MKHLSTFKTLTALLFAVAAIVAGQPAWAEDDPSAFRMSVVLDRAEGKAVARGEYEKAILRITTHSNRQPVATNTNLCVAHTMVGQYKHAQNYCDKAVEAAAKAAEVGLRKDRDYTMEWALALSNRGVLRATMGDVAGAEADFRKAIALHSDSALPAQNMAFFNGETFESIAKR